QGFVRNNLRVLQGGGKRGATTTRGEATAPIDVPLPLFAGASALAVAETTTVTVATVTPGDTRLEQIREARMKGYEGDSCGECGNFTLDRNGTCLKCDTCGSTSGCS
ncbi:MAG: hypothetical protein JO001_17710, partial [Alphaproteobacteria bacterium]|nr:hypothetical protein [Alphaproteobacteria bacterium]